MLRIIKIAAKFLFVMFLTTIICTIFWQNVVAENLYDNSDENMMGYLNPFFLDGWIGQGNFPVITVQQVVHGRSMSDPDEIKQGWSIPKLWDLWFGLFAISSIISILLARIRWLPPLRNSGKV